VLGQVQVDAVGAVGQADGDVDDLAAQGGTAGVSAGAAGQGAGGAGQVVRHGAEQPGTIGTKTSRWEVCQGAVDKVGEVLSGSPYAPGGSDPLSPWRRWCQ